MQELEEELHRYLSSEGEESESEDSNFSGMNVKVEVVHGEAAFGSPLKLRAEKSKKYDSNENYKIFVKDPVDLEKIDEEIAGFGEDEESGNEL